ncbi:MAG: rod shape-determining protein MreD [Defluviitaleaceae bacterium]|nr:rod shape-determining protein MreD [Defluviitaleaceae bacterium]
MRILILTAIILINFILQTTFRVEIFGISPNTAIIIVVSFAILRQDVEGGIIGFFTGLLHDVFFGNSIGFNALVYMLIGFFAGKPFKDFNKDNYLLPLFLVTIATIFYNFSHYIFHFLFRARLELFEYGLNIILPSSLYNLALSFPIYIFLYIVNEKIEIVEKSKRRIFK